MFRKTTLAVLACVGAFSAQNAAADGFKLDLNRDGLRKMGGATFFSDLAVGESAYMPFHAMCMNGKDLYLKANRQIGRKSTYSYSYKFTRRAGNLVLGTIEKGEKAKASARTRLPLSFSNLTSCEIAQATTSYNLNPVRVISINGQKSLSALLRVLK